MNRISIIMLTYNREPLVGRAIESILGQTYRNFELIIVDNGSTDRSGQIADEYAVKDSRILVMHRERGNIGSGRNAGLDAAKGDYIAFIDDDDWCEPDFLAFLYKLAQENETDVSICGAFKEEAGETVYVGTPGEALVMDAEEAILSLLWRRRYNTGFPTKLIAAGLFRDYRFLETGEYEDICLLYKILARARKVAYHGLPKYHVCRHAGNHSAVTANDAFITPDYLAAYRKAYRERTEWLCKRFPNRTGDWQYFDWSFQLSMVNKILSNDLKECKMHFTEMRQELLEHSKEFISSPNILDCERSRMEKCILSKDL